MDCQDWIFRLSQTLKRGALWVITRAVMTKACRISVVKLSSDDPSFSLTSTSLLQPAATRGSNADAALAVVAVVVALVVVMLSLF